MAVHTTTHTKDVRMGTNLATCLWFNGQAEAAAQFYAGIFKNSRITATTRYPEGTPGLAGSVMTIAFELDGREFVGLNGGPNFKFSPAISFITYCDTQAEVDQMWDALSAGGKPNQCGWLDDRFGVSWQVVPRMLPALFTQPDKAAVNRATQAMMGMTKLDIAALQRAFDGA